MSGGRRAQSSAAGLREGANRLVVRHIELENFKSYCGKHVIGPFHANFSAVIGPNGSGKSNLLDALVFIFGKRASWMRLKTLKELIHRGNCDCQRAAVTVAFAELGADGAEVDAFAVTRTVALSDEVGYRINGQRSSHEEVVRRLRLKGIDLVHNRFMILQGEVEQISLMRPKGARDAPGFLEYLEEIIGTDRHVERIEELERAHAQLRLSRIEQAEHFRIAEEEMQQLLRLRDVALDFLRSEERCFQLASLGRQVQRHAARAAHAAELREAERLRAADAEARRRLAAASEAHKPQAEAHARLKAQAERLAEAVARSDAAFQRLEADYNAEQEKLKELGTQLLAKEEELKHAQKRLNRLIEEQSLAESALPPLEEQLRAREKGLRDLRRQIAEAEKAVMAHSRPLFAQRGAAEEDLRRRGEQLSAAEEALRVQSEAVAAAQAGAQSARERRAALVARVAQAEAAVVARSSAGREAAAALKRCEQALAEAVKTRDARRGEVFSAEVELKRLQGSALAARDRLQQRTKDTVVLQRLQAASTVERALTGILGRIGDGVVADERLNVAVSSAGAAGWNKVMARSSEEALAAINFLRKEQIGACGFLALDRQEALRQRMESAFAAPPRSVRLFDLLHFRSAQARVGAYFALGDTLLVADIGVGREVAFGGGRRWRVVTLAGQVIERSGTMTGGGAPAQNMVLTARAERPARGFDELIAVLRERSGEPREVAGGGDADTEQLVAQFNALRADMNRLRAEADRAGAQADGAQADLSALAERLRREGRALDEEKGAAASAAQELEEVQGLVARLEQTREDDLRVSREGAAKARADVERANEKLAELQEQIARKGGEGLMRLNRELQSAEAERGRLAEQALAQRGKLASAQELLEALKAQLARLASERAEAEALRRPIDAEMSRLLAAAEQVMAENNAKAKELAEQKEELARLARELEGYRKETDGLRKLADERGRELAAAEQKAAEAQGATSTAAAALQAVRADFEETVSAYGFYTDLDRIRAVAFPPPVANSPAKAPLAVEDRSSLHRPRTVEWEDVWATAVGGDYPDELLARFSQLSREIDLKLEAEQRGKARHSPNLDVLNRFLHRHAAFRKKHEEFQAARKGAERLREELDALKDQRKREFFEGFNAICARLRETYDALTDGGSAELELLDPGDPFSQGVHYSVRPPGKSWKQMLKLSGGEKTLSSLALVFALHYYKPNPVYFMDEIDAALDFKNVAIVARFIKRKTQNAQFLVISLRNSMFETADQLFGVYRAPATSRVVALVPALFAQCVADREPRAKIEPDID